MKKLAAVFVIAVLAPAVMLAWLATRSLRDQELVVHSQRALLHQSATDALADDFNIFLDDVRVFYGGLLERLIVEVGPEELAQNYDQILRSHWSQAGVGAAVSDEGDWMSPPVTSTDPEVRRFLRDTQAFLLNAAPSEVYLAPTTAGKVVTVQELPASSWSFDRIESKEELESESTPSEALVSASADTPPPAAPAPEFSVADAKPARAIGSDGTDAEMSAAGSLAQADAAPFSAKGAPPAKSVANAEPKALKEPAMVLQQKVAINEDRYRSRSSQQLRQQPQSAAPAQSQRRQSLDSEPLPNLSNQSELYDGSLPPTQSEEAQTYGSQAQAPLSDSRIGGLNGNYNRTRNVTPLGQLDQLQEGGQYFRLAQAANDALAGNPNRLAWSNLDVNTGQLREIMADRSEGAISRFVSGGLQILLWRRDPAAPGMVFWVQLDVEEVKNELTAIIRETAEGMPSSEVSLALLDAGGQVVSQTREGFTTNWRQPFVATEVGEILPHWEVAAYLLDPRAVARSARSARLTLWMLVPILLAAIGVGGLLIIRDIGREMHLARQKTDFVSNVSHELKTPLTSIRMFSDLLGNKSDLQETKRIEYSGIISREAARLSRLINNLLDFSRMERGEKRYRMEQFELRDFVTETVDSYRHQIESDGFQLNVSNLPADTGPAAVNGDKDAIAQVFLNLLSNAEKYGGDARQIEVDVSRHNGDVEIGVLDRGPGVSRKNASRIFDKFFRVDDSLSSGIEGSGLGLTLARQIARGHGGDITYQARPKGGSRFTLRLPLLSPDSGNLENN